ncbi:MAG: hypothetical protein A2622_08550 [Bdellovibrionales bacterium RIFCSPHIGHO2_01_FULL_40_29]|nr:MAG: hypothetical protein A2622_08550 [Bdellovibrionales bacterium RIFCSPHIGHO2_01_FULL_40_29]OFZ35538.1 MAG: hypothetical protein A3D17_07785 [Bdellovibrionales bacterium RIFCSPHIGHO2_02_FULL_40_15]
MKKNGELIIHSRERDLGGFNVHRVLPYIKKRAIGPFVFLDHMGPMKIDETHVLDVRPHPHIGLATVTYLFEGRGFHRDSIGSKQLIEPGDLNWMTAGRGIVHSERTPTEDRDPNLKKSVHGVQIWVGLPKEHEECEPNFTNWQKDKFPSQSLSEGFTAKLLLGEFQEKASPVPTLWRTLYLDCECKANSNYEFSFGEEEIGFLIVAGSCEIDGHDLKVDDLILVGDPAQVSIKAKTDARVLVIGGKPFPEERFIWWNFVSSSKERIHKAADDWKNNRIGQIEGETEFTPLPETPLP